MGFRENIDAEAHGNAMFITFFAVGTFFAIIVLALLLVFKSDDETINKKTACIRIENINYNTIIDTIDIVRATTYNCSVSQTDSTPNHTADGSYIDPVKLKNKEIKWIALSRDLIWDEERQGLFSDTTLWRGPFAFGDTITVYSEKFPNINGDWVVHDCMGDQYRDSMDFLIDPSNNVPKLGVATDVKIVFCIGDRRNVHTKM